MTSPTSRTGLARAGALALAICAALGPLAACTSDNSLAGKTGPIGPYRLVAFDSCDDALGQIRSASQNAVGPYGFGNSYGFSVEDGLGPVPPVPQAAAPPGANTGDRSATGASSSVPSGGTPAHSDTNNQEAGVDEPDLVKTDGNRILVVHNGVLNVIDAASHQITGTLSLAPSNDPLRYSPADLLLSGDHALVLYGSYPVAYRGGGPVPLPANVGPALPPDTGTVNGGGASGYSGRGGAPAAQGNVAAPAV